MARESRALHDTAVRKARRPRRSKVDKSPQHPQDKVFCERFLAHFDMQRAFLEAGFKATPKNVQGQAQRKLDQFADYIRPLQEQKAREVAKVLVIEQQDVLNAMARKAVFNPGDFVERANTPLFIEKGEDEGKPVLWNGKAVYESRLKPFDELTEEQKQTVEITGVVGGRVQYRLPTIREQHAYLTSVGRQYGLFLEKLILERHNHQHAHAHLHLEDVPTARLRELTVELLPLVGSEYAQRLGFTPEEIAAAVKAQEPVATQEPKMPAPRANGQGNGQGKGNP